LQVRRERKMRWMERERESEGGGDIVGVEWERKEYERVEGYRRSPPSSFPTSIFLLPPHNPHSPSPPSSTPS
jgi:hypothetical protein